MFSKVLIANRGEIACRIARTLRRLGVRSVAVYSEADAHALHVETADEAVLLGPSAPAESYLRGERILEIAERVGAEAIHPGYGFLSENAEFAEACAAKGICFVGPRPAHLRSFGLKHEARRLARESRVPLLPGTGLLDGIEEAVTRAGEIGFPVMLKSTAGGGGIGLQTCWDEPDLRAKFVTVQRLSEANFREGGVYLEKFVEVGRHVEVQIFGDGRGGVLALGERDCSVQRRNQKVIEETPAPGLPESVRADLLEASERLGASVSYASAGTVEFLYDAHAEAAYFLEVNTRLQVEHGVTELVTGIDLVEWMLWEAAGELPDLASLRPKAHGHAIQARLYAEDPQKGFQPSTGLLTQTKFPADVRVDSGFIAGSEVSPYYDPLLAKILVHAPTRAEAVEALAVALAESRVDGIETNRAYLHAIVTAPAFRHGGVSTNFLKDFATSPSTIDVLSPGTQTTVQDVPGRLGYWSVGVPPSGPMDPVSFRLANRAVGNPSDAAGLEITLSGPTLRFNVATTICLCGGEVEATLNGSPMRSWTAVAVTAGSTVSIGAMRTRGARAALAIRGGIDVPLVLGSRSTFTLGRFGGHGGRALRSGDLLTIGEATSCGETWVIPESSGPVFTNDWEIGVLYGPHGAPDFFTDDGIAEFFASTWEVHYNSSRTGVRLIGPTPRWAREDGGEAGLHPSNLHDNAYAIGSVDFTGDMPIILGPDGPSLGGFVCPAVVVEAEIWKLGQLRAGDRVRFRRLDLPTAAAALAEQDILVGIETPPLSSVVGDPQADARLAEAILDTIEPLGDRPRVVYRGAGDRYVLVEYGPLELDLNLRFRVHALMEWLREQRIAGVVDITPGIRSLQVHFETRILSLSRLMAILRAAEESLPAVADMEIAARVVHLPLSWEDPSTLEAIARYTQSVRADAPWCPSNIEFIRRINGLDSVDDVRRIVFDAEYLVMGLGDVYLGAPVAVPLDPRHRLVTTKYNPARTWTPENAVGIGGAYLCIYGMEGPGGYQFVGRTIQMWNRFRQTEDFVKDRPWLLRFFDILKFYPVSESELRQMREDFPRGKFRLSTEERTFRLSEYNAFLSDIAPEAADFKRRQQAAFDAERERWKLLPPISEDVRAAAPADVIELPSGGSFVDAPAAGSLWKTVVQTGETVSPGDVIAILESMKMEIGICAPMGGRLERFLVSPGDVVHAGDPIAVLVS